MIVGSGLLGASGLMGASGIIGDGMMGSEDQEPVPPIEGPSAWYRFNNGITVTGAGVSQWDDASGNGNHLTQGTDTNRPAKQAGGEILFDGVDNFLRKNPFSLTQPITIYMLVKPVTWTLNDALWGNNVLGGGNTVMRQTAVSPQIKMIAGVAEDPTNSNLTVGAYAAMASVLNGASSVIHVNGSAAATGNPGTQGFAQFILGAHATNFGWINMEVKEVLIYSAAHDATQRQTVFDYLVTL